MRPEKLEDCNGLYCPSCRQQSDKNICQCGTETDPMAEIELTLWEGVGGKSMLIVFVTAEECGRFLNGVYWDDFTRNYVKPDVRLEVGIIGGERLEVAGTNLIKF